MDKEEIIFFIGNVLVGLACPFLFLLSDNPFKTLCGTDDKEGEDLGEQGKLLKLPCAVDSEVWYIDKYADLSIEIVRGIVDGYLWYRSCGFALNIVWDKPIMGHFGYKRKEIPFYEIGKTVFLTQEEAETALKELYTSNRP